MSSYSELVGFVSSLLNPLRGNMGKNNMFSNIKTVLTSFMKSFFSIHYFSLFSGYITQVHVCLEFFSYHSVQGAYELSVLWVQYTRYNQNPQIKVSVVNIFGEGNGTPLQYSCLANPMDRGAWWAAVHGVAQSWTWLKRLSSSSSSKPFPLFWWSDWKHMAGASDRDAGMVFQFFPSWWPDSSLYPSSPCVPHGLPCITAVTEVRNV